MIELNVLKIFCQSSINYGWPRTKKDYILGVRVSRVERIYHLFKDE